MINIEEFQFDSDWLDAQIGGMIPTTFSSWSDFLTSDRDVSMNADFELNAAELLSQMSHTFAIKEKMRVTSGKLSGNITASRGRLNGQVNLNELAGTIEDKKLALSQPVTGKLQISTDKKKIRFDELDVTASFAKISASGLLEQLKCDGYVNLEKLQSELHKKMSNLDRFWGFWGEAGVMLGKFGEDAKPIFDRIREIVEIAWRTQSAAEELRTGLPLPMIGSGEDSDKEE